MNEFEKARDAAAMENMAKYIKLEASDRPPAIDIRFGCFCYGADWATKWLSQNAIGPKRLREEIKENQQLKAQLEIAKKYIEKLHDAADDPTAIKNIADEAYEVLSTVANSQKD